MNEIYTLREIIEVASDLPWDAGLFVKEGAGWKPDAPAAILDDKYEVPAFAIEHGLVDDLGVQDVQCVIANTREQVPDASVEDILKAIAYYSERDAFIQWEKLS